MAKKQDKNVAALEIVEDFDMKMARILEENPDAIYKLVKLPDPGVPGAAAEICWLPAGTLITRIYLDTNYVDRFGGGSYLIEARDPDDKTFRAKAIYNKAVPLDRAGQMLPIKSDDFEKKLALWEAESKQRQDLFQAQQAERDNEHKRWLEKFGMEQAAKDNAHKQWLEEYQVKQAAIESERAHALALRDGEGGGIIQQVTAGVREILPIIAGRRAGAKNPALSQLMPGGENMNAEKEMFKKLADLLNEAQAAKTSVKIMCMALMAEGAEAAAGLLVRGKQWLLDKLLANGLKITSPAWFDDLYETIKKSIESID